MTEEEVRALFTLAGISVLAIWERPNQYWPDAYVDLRKNSPWWLVKTEVGMIEIGHRKRVISIDWRDTPIRKEMTTDDVTKTDTIIHAWNRLDALKYLTALSHEINRVKQPVQTFDSIYESARLYAIHHKLGIEEHRLMASLRAILGTEMDQNEPL